MNKVMLIGNVGKDPDIHYFEADQAVAQVSLATTEKGYTLPNGTQVPDHTDWHNLVFYRGLAKVVGSECATSEPRSKTSRRWLMRMRNWEARRKRAISSRITVTAMRSASRRFAIWALPLKSPDSKDWERFRLMNSPISSVPTCDWSRLRCIKPIRCRSCWNIIWVRTRWSARISSSKIW